MRRTSDAEITRPQNELPSEPPPLPAWHVHLELQPEELITLHRLGFTGGALAWREGMPEWQPLRVEQGLRDASKPPVNEESLPQPIPLTRRSRSSSGSIASLDRRRNSPFNTGRHSPPPIAMAVPRPELMLPPPPRIEARSASELASDEATVAINEPWLKLDHSRSPVSVVREQQPPSIPPLALDARPRPPRTTSSRAMWLGAAALVALSASNGALVSALLWSLRHDPARPATSAQLRTSGPAPSAASGALAAAECASPSAAAHPTAVSALAQSAGSGRASPVSVDQLPLLAGQKTASERSSSEHSRTRSVAPAASASSSRGASSRKSSARVVLAEDAAPARRAEPAATPQATAPGPIDRRALGQAVARAASAASSCSQGPEKGRVALTFSPAGSVQAAQLEASFGEPGVNSCVLRAMGRARVRPFVGEPVTVHKTVSW